jgi:hypothetical protein
MNYPCLQQPPGLYEAIHRIFKQAINHRETQTQRHGWCILSLRIRLLSLCIRILSLCSGMLSTCVRMLNGLAFLPLFVLGLPGYHGFLRTSMNTTDIKHASKRKSTGMASWFLRVTRGDSKDRNTVASVPRIPTANPRTKLMMPRGHATT